MPFFLFGISQLGDRNWWKLSVAFIVIHLFHNGASNAFNSYFDKDEGSIGGIENPPPVDKELYIVSLVFDVIAVVLGYLVNPYFAVMVFLIGVASKAYSHPWIRLKKYAVLGLLTVVFFQGVWTYFMAIVAQYGQYAWEELPKAASYSTHLQAFLIHPPMQQVYAGLICSLMLLGSYPMTQVYQHEEDAKRGDKTFSLWLGVRGTFLWTMSVFTLATALFVWYFVSYDSWTTALLFLFIMSPVTAFFLKWLVEVWNDPTKANYKSTMKLNLISSVCFNLFFVVLIILNVLK